MMSNSPLPTPAPFVSVETEPYWSGAKAGKLVLPHCRACDHTIWYPKAFCGECGAFDVEWREASGLGTLYSFTQVFRGEGPYRECASFVLALVDLDEGARVLTNIVDADPAGLAVGQRLRAVFHDAGEAAALVRFTPIPTSSDT
ncbi:Zn-ribbon domain-containing OB-fold protein [Novosphingobium rhizosphaerae]|uniref:Zn-ribbon domain-containing OB-fold protein n=1 Tax=Novosphingobium rhizosphaerae TaxID=1551649 RepID=UPI00184BA462